MKRLSLRAAVMAVAVASLPVPPVQASGIPTVDAAAISQMVNQIIEMQKQYAMLKDQYDSMVQQYNQLKEMTSKLEGITDVADLVRNADRLEQFPEFYENMTTFTVEMMDTGARAIYEMRGYGEQCENLGEGLKEICEQENSYLASQEYQVVENIKKVGERMGNLETLMDEIKNCQTSKEIQDLQARIQAEMGVIEIGNMQVELSRETFEAALEGARRMEEARRNRFLYVSSSSSSSHDLSSAFD